MRWTSRLNAGLMLTALMATGLACNTSILLNALAPLGDDNNPLQGTVGVVFVNETDARVITYWGAYNPLDLKNNVQVQKLTLEAGDQSANTTTLTCTRRLTLAGPDLRFVVEEACLDDITADEINETILFSDVADPDADNAEAPTAGTADPVTYFIGIDYSCGDFIEIHFKQDPNTGAFSTEIFATSE